MVVQQLLDKGELHRLSCVVVDEGQFSFLFHIFFHLFTKIPLSHMVYLHRLIEIFFNFLGNVAVHMVGDGGTRGQQLELLLSLLLYLRKTTGTKALRLICMSATISNLDEIEQWLHAKKFYTK
jgi:hypothetical protein